MFEEELIGASCQDSDVHFTEELLESLTSALEARTELLQTAEGVLSKPCPGNSQLSGHSWQTSRACIALHFVALHCFACSVAHLAGRGCCISCLQDAAAALCTEDVAAALGRLRLICQAGCAERPPGIRSAARTCSRMLILEAAKDAVRSLVAVNQMDSTHFLWEPAVCRGCSRVAGC